MTLCLASELVEEVGQGGLAPTLQSSVVETSEISRDALLLLTVLMLEGR